ncbi:MAG TPA: alpha/beta hydrolase domain-containing protein, partial [Burkholderiales bacterium]|nr:alpha/beta hydrolase domain-containing protein [Burkholderiales bacterium]
MAAAEIARIDITKRSDVLGGRSYGDVGVYEWIEGRAHFTLDPANKRNDIIIDLKLAPRNAQGLVEFSADVGIMRPKIAERANGVVIFDVVNRGRHTILEYLNRGNRTAALDSAAFVGDDFLMKQGVTLVWLGWQQDLPADAGMMRLAGPVAAGVKGRVYGEFSVASRLTDISLGDRTSIPYAVADLKDPQRSLAVSPSRALLPRAIPNENWSFARMEKGTLVGDPLRVYVEGGFVPGAIYQFAYGAQNPQIAGLGLAGVRDLISWIRHDAAALVRGTHAYAFGISQSGRFLRQFLYEGFNEDTAGRRVFDGMMVHIAGGARRGFNERFSQP